MQETFDSLVHEAFARLWPEREFSYTVIEKYNRRLGPFNANIMLKGSELTVKYNLQWKNVDSEIRLGLIQHLLLKMLSRGDEKKRSTFNINLYNNFCKQIPTYVAQDHDLASNCEDLRGSFARMNEMFFDDLLTECTLKWGKASFRRLASYNFHTDSITVSSVFRDAPQHVLDLLMYHEMLHKDLQFDCKNGRVHTHTPEFKRRERLYPQFDAVEKEIGVLIRSARRVQGREQKMQRSARNGKRIFQKLHDFFS